MITSNINVAFQSNGGTTVVQLVALDFVFMSLTHTPPSCVSSQLATLAPRTPCGWWVVWCDLKVLPLIGGVARVIIPIIFTPIPGGQPAYVAIKYY